MRILMQRLGPGLGDILRCLPALAAARRRWPTAEIAFATDPRYATLFTGHPDVDRVLSPATRLGRRGRRILDGRYDHVIDLFEPAAELERREPNLSRQEIFCRLVAENVPGTLKSGYRVHFPRVPFSHYRVTEAERDWAEEYLSSQARPPGGRVSLAIQRHAANPVRDWPWVDELAGLLRKAGCRVLILEREMGITVRQLAAVIAVCDLLIGPDSGPLHVAAVVGTRCLGLFGPTDPEVICKHYPRHVWLRARRLAAITPAAVADAVVNII